jgi:hypothetical protein
MKRPLTNRQRTPQPPLPQDVATAAQTRGLTPLAYLLQVLNDPRASARRRDRAAVVAARYLHRRPADYGVKKQELAEAAREAGGDGSGWEDDLAGDWRQ